MKYGFKATQSDAIAIQTFATNVVDCSWGKWMTTENTIQKIEALINRPDLLHTPPEVAQSLLKLTEDADISIVEIVDCLGADPAMSSRVLHFVNSPRFGLSTSVTSLHQAVTLLGQRSIRLIAMTFCITNTFASGKARVLYNDFWRRALTTAAAAHKLCRYADDVDPHDAYTTGLLCNVGSLVFAQAEGEWYLSLFQRHTGSSLPRAEREYFGADHAEIGGHLLSKWSFPKVTCDAVRAHLCPTIPDPLTQVACGGCLISNALWDADAGSVSRCRTFLREIFAIDVDTFTDLALQCRDEVMLEMAIYGVESAIPLDPEMLLDLAKQRYLETSLETAMDMDSFESVFGE